MNGSSARKTVIFTAGWALLAMFGGCASGGSGGSSQDFPFVNNGGGSSRVADDDALYLATFQHLIRTERWVGTDYICIGVGTLLFDPQSPPRRMMSRLSSGTVRVVAATQCDIGRSQAQHRATRNQAQLIVVSNIKRTSDGAEAEAFQLTSRVDQELFRCILTEADGEWKVEQCQSRRL